MSDCEACARHQDELKRARVEAGVWRKDAEDWKVRCAQAERDVKNLRNNLAEVYELAKLAHVVD